MAPMYLLDTEPEIPQVEDQPLPTTSLRSGDAKGLLFKDPS